MGAVEAFVRALFQWSPCNTHCEQKDEDTTWNHPGLLLFLCKAFAVCYSQIVYERQSASGIVLRTLV